MQEDLLATKVLDSRRGARHVYRWPAGVRPQQVIGLLTGVDLLTTHLVAPGSVVEGHYYAVVDDRPVAELPLHIALAIRDLVGRSPRNIRLTVADHLAVLQEKAADNRRRKARVARGLPPEGLSRGQVAPTGDHRERRRRREEALSETRDGYRHQALARAVVCTVRLGESYDDFERLVRASPVSSKLAGQSPTWLRRHVWDPVTTHLNSEKLPTGSGGGQPSQLVRHWQVTVATPAAARWLAHADLVLTALELQHEHQRGELRKVCEVHAETFVSYGFYGPLHLPFADVGPCYYLAQPLLRERVGMRSGSAMKRRLQRLETLGLIKALPRTELVAGQATYYQLMIEHEVLVPPAPGNSLCPTL